MDLKELTVMNLKELTIEITNYCPHDCKYCSSNAISDIHNKKIKFISIRTIKKFLKDLYLKYIIISGGEPLTHPNFYNIKKLCEKHAEHVIVYTNEFEHIIFNGNVLDGIYIEENIVINENVKRIHILKKIKQGREKTRPAVKFSRNWTEDCSCNKHVLRQDGKLYRTPCRKHEKVNI